MISIELFFLAIVASLVGMTVGFGLLFAWLIIRSERNERRRDREHQRLLLEQRKELEREYGVEIEKLKRDMEAVKTENTKLQAQVTALTAVLVKMEQRMGISIEAEGDINVGEFVGQDKAMTTQTNIRA